MMVRTLAKWSPDTLDDMILTKRFREVFEAYFTLDANELMSMFLVGNPGLGKSTFARIISKHFSWDGVWRKQLTDDEWWTGNRLNEKKISEFLLAIASHGKALDAEFRKDGQRALFVIDELQVLTSNHQRRLNSALEYEIGPCIVATSNLDGKDTIAANTLSRFEQFDFDMLTLPENRDEIIDDMVRVAKRAIKSVGADTKALSDGALRDIAAETITDFRKFFEKVSREIFLASRKR
jgi:replication-associated recombination protein RarA